MNIILDIDYYKLYVIIMSEEEFEDSVYIPKLPESLKIHWTEGKPIPLKIIHDSPKNIDKINNLVQKEINLSKAGVTRYKYMLVIAEALEATKWADECDEQGNVKRVKIADAQRRQWGAEQAARLYGDMIERKEIEHDLGDKTLERFRSLSVAELKARAADILLGKPVSRLPVIDV